MVNWCRFAFKYCFYGYMSHDQRKHWLVDIDETIYDQWYFGVDVLLSFAMVTGHMAKESINWLKSGIQNLLWTPILHSSFNLVFQFIFWQFICFHLGWWETCVIVTVKIRHLIGNCFYFSASSIIIQTLTWCYENSLWLVQCKWRVRFRSPWRQYRWRP